MFAVIKQLVARSRRRQSEFLLRCYSEPNIETARFQPEAETVRKITLAFAKEGIGFFDHYGGHHVAGVFLRQARNDNDPAAAEQQPDNAFALANRMADAIVDRIRKHGECRPRDLEKWALRAMKSPTPGR